MKIVGAWRNAILASTLGLCISCLLATEVAISTRPAMADESPVQFINRMARELIAANRSGSAPSFAAAIYKNAHVKAIGHYALGNYRNSLKQADRDNYHNGMVRFISRYAAGESKKYQVERADIKGQPYRSQSGIMVDTVVTLRDGQTYDVQWLLQASGGTYKVRDAKVNVMLGEYWMTPFLKDLFEKYIAENGSVTALVVALNR